MRVVKRNSVCCKTAEFLKPRVIVSSNFWKMEDRWKETVPKINGVNLIHIIEQLNGNHIPSAYCLPNNGSVSF